MKIYICAPKITHESLDFLKSTIEILTKYNVKDIDDTYFKSSLEENKINPKKSFDNIEKSLNACDALIVETSYRSSGIGLIIGMAIAKDKPILILHSENIKDSISINLSSTTSKSNKIFFKGYTNKSLNQHIKDFINMVEDESKSKLLINLPSSLTKYLNWFTKNYRISRADYIRNLIEKDMSKNNEWKELLTS